MSRRTKQPAGGSRRTRRAELPLPQPPAAARAESPKIVSNPIFRCEAGPSQQHKPPGGGDQLRCVYRPNSLYALVHDPAASAAAASANGGTGKPLPLPLPPCRAHRAGQGASGSHVPASRIGPAALVAGAPHGRVLRRASPRDPFLAAYVACSKSAGAGEDGAAGVNRPQQKQRKGKKKRRNAAAKKRGKEGEEIAVRACGAIWSGGWAAAGAKYAGAMSCRHGCAVAEQQQQGDAAPAAAAKKEAGEDAPAAVSTLDLSWAPAVLSARALERRRQQR